MKISPEPAVVSLAGVPSPFRCWGLSSTPSPAPALEGTNISTSYPKGLLVAGAFWGLSLPETLGLAGMDFVFCGFAAPDRLALELPSRAPDPCIGLTTQERISVWPAVIGFCAD